MSSTITLLSHMYRIVGRYSSLIAHVLVCLTVLGHITTSGRTWIRRSLFADSRIWSGKRKNVRELQTTSYNRGSSHGRGTASFSCLRLCRLKARIIGGPIRTCLSMVLGRRERLVAKSRRDLPLMHLRVTRQRHSPSARLKAARRRHSPSARVRTTRRSDSPSARQMATRQRHSLSARLRTTRRSDSPSARQMATRQRHSPSARLRTTRRSDSPSARQMATRQRHSPSARLRATPRRDSPLMRLRVTGQRHSSSARRNHERATRRTRLGAARR
jgi:hypothetical protein